MKKLKNIIFYAGIIGGFASLMYWIVELGSDRLQPSMKVTEPGKGNNEWLLFLETFKHNLTHPLAMLLLQIVTIILIARLFGWVCKKIGQPAVIGEIIAGIVLGPSLFGMYFPGISSVLFPAQSLGNLEFLSQIGLILFMFVVGMEIDLKVLKKQAHEAVVISHASIIIPFALGMGLAYFIYKSFAPQGVPFVSFALFLGISMSITAFPVLARIAQEKGIHKTKLGTIVLTCAAADDITAWSLLAVVIAIVKAGSFVSALPTVFMAIIYVVILMKWIRPFLNRIGNIHATRENLNKPVVAIFFLTLILSAYITEIIGIHALFGAFMAGAIMPDNQNFKRIFIEKVEDVALILLLPLFFVFTGLRTQIGLLNDPHLWMVFGWVLLVAILGKFAGSALAARVIGQNWRDSLTIGALMNTRGLVELVALNIGYDLGVLTPEIFAMLVIMALVTTFMTSPALSLIDRVFTKKTKAGIQEIIDLSKFKILISFGKPVMGKKLLRLASYFVNNNYDTASISALHISPIGLFNKFKLDNYEKESFNPLIGESKRLNIPVKKIFKASQDIYKDILEVTNKGDFDLLLVGIGVSIYKGSILGNIMDYSSRFLNPDFLVEKITGKENSFKSSIFAGSTRQILSNSKVPVGILIDNNFHDINSVVVPFFDENDTQLIEFAKKFIAVSGIQIVFFDFLGTIKTNVNVRESIRAISQQTPNHIHIMENEDLINLKIRKNDLILVSLESWEILVDSKNPLFQNVPTVLIIKFHHNQNA